MSTFNTTRFCQAFKCQFLVLRKTWIRLFGIFTLVMFMANLFFTRVSGTKYDYMISHWDMEAVWRTYNNYVQSTVAFGLIFFCFAMLAAASLMFSGMKDTRKRSAFLLWPVSNLEKYVISIILSVFWMMVITFAAYVLADAMRVFVDWVTGRIIIWGVPIVFTQVFGQAVFHNDWQMVWWFFTIVFYIHSLYIVGGTLFRRQQFLFTSATIAVVGILFMMLLQQTNPDVEYITGTWDEKTETYHQIFHPFFYILNTTLCALIVFHYWASYKLFTRIQVINNKWLNV
ncbi:MAG: hypothetical protein IKN02_07285 [Prevotella sp.]|nr:hypothetical protein [Prevotella sp.]